MHNNLQYENYLVCNIRSIYELEIQQISPDEKYLVVQDMFTLRVIDLRNKKNIRNIFRQSKNYFTICRFSTDSKFLICGTPVGLLYILSVVLGFKQVSREQAHELWVYNMQTYDDKLVISCSVDEFIVTNMKYKIKKLKIQFPNINIINSIDYDKKRNIIVVGSDDITIYNGENGEILFSDITNRPILYVQFISDNNLVIYQDRKLKLLKINDKFNGLELLKQFEEEEYIWNISPIHDCTQILLITQYYFQFLDPNLNILQIINIQSEQLGIITKNIRVFYDFKQLNSLKYVLINLKGNQIIDFRQISNIKKNLKILIPN